MDVDKLANELLVGGRLISHLKVVELKDELKKRGMKNTGNKPQLQELLVAAVIQEQRALATSQIQQNIQHVPVSLPADNAFGNIVQIPNMNNVYAGGDSFSVNQNQNTGIKLIVNHSPTKSTFNPNEVKPLPPQVTPISYPEVLPVQEKVPEKLPISENASETLPVQEQVPNVPVKVTASEQSSEVVSETVPEVVSETVPEVVSETVPEVVSETVPEVVSETVPEVVPEAVLEQLSVTEPVSEQVSITEVVSEVLETKSNQIENVSEMNQTSENKISNISEKQTELNDVPTMEDAENNTSVDSSLPEDEPNRRLDSPKLTIRPRKLTLQRSQNQETESPQIDKAEKRPKWGSKRDSSAQKGITSNELKQIIDESKLLEDNNNNNNNSQKVGKTDSTFNKADISMEDSSIDTNTAASAAIAATGTRKSHDSQDSSSNQPTSDLPFQNSTVSETPKDDDNIMIDRPKSPAKNAPSCILHILGLARPYTMPSLKRLLTKFGSIDDKKFWTDKKRSECYAVYTTIEIAQQTRDYLHGLRWPVSSPNTLSVDFENESNLEKCLNQPDEAVVFKKSDDGKNGLSDKYDIVKNDIDKNQTGTSKNLGITKTVREWDKNKDDIGSKRKRDSSRSRSPSPKRKERRQSSPDRRDKNAGRRGDDSVGRHSPQRRSGHGSQLSQPTPKMDDLFKKTITQPHIYYKPLNDEEARQRDIENRSRPRPMFINRKAGRFMDHRRRRSPFNRRDRSFSPPGRRPGPPGGYNRGPGARFRNSPINHHQSSPGPYRRGGSPFTQRRGQSPFRRGGQSPPPFRRGASPPMHPNRRGRSPSFSRRGSPPPRRSSPPVRSRGSPPFRRGSPPRRRSPPRYRR